MTCPECGHVAKQLPMVGHLITEHAMPTDAAVAYVLSARKPYVLSPEGMAKRVAASRAVCVRPEIREKITATKRERSPILILRDGARITPAEAAELLGVTTTTIANIAAGKSKPGGPTMKLATLLGLTFSRRGMGTADALTTPGESGQPERLTLDDARTEGTT